MLKLPYSLADFYRIRTQGYSYVDRTAHLRDLEALGDALLFLRPRRFGKSLWLDTLRCYYDLRLAAEHDRLFGALAVGREPTPLAHRYFVMSGDFSEVGEHGSAAEIGRRLNNFLNSQIDLFLQGYAGELPAVTLQRNATDSLRHVLDDRRFIASLFFYQGLLTLESSAQRLRVPNLVVKELYLDRLLRLRLTGGEERNQAEEIVLAFFQDGDLEPLLDFVESKLFPALSSRDYTDMREVALKTLLLSLLFDDRRYTVFSELELGHGHADLCLLRRPVPAAAELCNLLLELKYVPRKKLGLSGAELRALSDAELRVLGPVAQALAEAREQLGRNREGFAARFGEAEARRLRCHAVVAVGLERLVGG